MKTIALIRLFVSAVVLFTVSSCGDRKAPVTNFSGSVSEVLVIMDKSDWNSAAGDTVKDWFRQEQLGLPQPEPVFDIINLPRSSFEGNIKAYRNILYTEISPSVQKPVFESKDGSWLKGQKYFRIAAPDKESFIREFNAHKEEMLRVFLQAEQDRQVAYYRQKPDPKIAAFLKDKYKLDCCIPSGYNINKEQKDFVWISRETKVDSRGLVIMQRKFEDIDQFRYQRIIDTVNAELQRTIPGPLDGSYMAIDTVTPLVMNTYNYAGDHYAVMMKGLWTVINDFMGGPFVLNVVLDKANDRVVYMMGYVYAPDDKKRNMVRQVEAIVFSAGFVE